ncbi:MFS transporter [Occallatibacter savannae]|uniref:MFS transporter n=1 Tax=Occallatibacter savannae TaxID=1002691 RepID=UPI000D696746|nr:MFS transporter [Occallatibacter savannae]
MQDSTIVTTKTATIVLAATILGSSMAFLDGTVVNLALPALQRDYKVDISVVQWVVEAYALTLASLLLVGGSLGDRYGRKRVYICGILLFAVSSVACGLAQSPHWLIVARTIQGAGAALLVPGSLALITAAFPESERGRAIGTWSGFSAITAAVGPVAGGWLIEHFSWRWVFLLNLPLAAIVVILCSSVPEARDEGAKGRLDWPGAAFTTIGLVGITYALIEWPSMNSHAILAAVAVGGVMALAAFSFIEQRAESPMVPFGLFRSRNFTGANLLTFLVYAPLGALLFFFPLDLIQIQHYSATKAGAAFSPFVLIMLVLSRWAGRLVERYGARLPLTIGPFITTGGYVAFALAPQDGHYWKSFLPAVLVTSLGMAITVAPLTTTVMNAVPESHAGVASGINNAVSRLASLIAVAAFGAILVMIFTHTLDQRLAQLSLPSAEAAQILAGRLQLAAVKTSSPEAARAIAESFVEAYRAVIWIGACSVFTGTVAGWLFIKPTSR